MRIRRRREVTVETERTYSIRIERPPVLRFCEGCRQFTEMLSINGAAGRAGIRWRAVLMRIENGALHHSETEAGEIYVCAVSLSSNLTSEQD